MELIDWFNLIDFCVIGFWIILFDIFEFIANGNPCPPRKVKTESFFSLNSINEITMKHAIPQ